MTGWKKTTNYAKKCYNYYKTLMSTYKVTLLNNNKQLQLKQDNSNG